MIMFLNWPRLSGEESFNMSKCKICGGESSHNGRQDGLVCSKCEREAEDDDVIIWAWEALSNGKSMDTGKQKGQTPGGTKTEGQAPGRDLDGGRTGPGTRQGGDIKGIY